jgi:hypothetical protein
VSAAQRKPGSRKPEDFRAWAGRQGYLARLSGIHPDDFEKALRRAYGAGRRAAITKATGSTA